MKLLIKILAVGTATKLGETKITPQVINDTANTKRGMDRWSLTVFQSTFSLFVASDIMLEKYKCSTRSYNLVI